MGLSRLALRVVTVRALGGVTLAGARVFDSAVEPIDLQARERREPFLVIYTDDHERDVKGRDLRHGGDSCELVIEVAVAARVPVSLPGEDAGSADEVVIPHTDAGMEAVLDLTGHQILEALISGGTAWSRLWQDFAMRVTRIASRRGASAEGGVRFAARQMVINCDLLSDPIRGQALTGPWSRLLDAMDDDAELAGLGAVLRHAIIGDAPLTDEALAASAFGLPAATVAALGLEPVRDDDGAAVELARVDADGTEAGGATWEIDEDAVADHYPEAP